MILSRPFCFRWRLATERIAGRLPNVMKIYLDNVIVCGQIRTDLEPAEMAAVQQLGSQPFKDRLLILTSRESWREQDRTNDAAVRAMLRQHRDGVPVVERDHSVLGFSQSHDHLGGFIASPLVTDIVDDSLFTALKAEGLQDADARHLMYAVCNGCDRFVTLDPDFLNRRHVLAAQCQGLRVAKPSELVAELSLGAKDNWGTTRDISSRN